MISSIDIILIIALIACVVHGFSKGLVSKLLSLAGLLTGIIIAAKDSKKIAQLVQGILGTSEVVSGIIGIVLLFALLFLIARLFGKFFKKISILKIWDKFGGAIFGALEGGVLLSLMLLFLSLFDIPAQGPSLQRSFMYIPLKSFAGVVYNTFITKTSTEKYIDKFFGSPQTGTPSDKK